MNQLYSMFAALALTVSASAVTPAVRTAVRVEGLPSLEVLSTEMKPGGVEIKTVRDARGRVYKQRLDGKHRTLSQLPKAPHRAKADNQTFYESFEDFQETYGLNWVPDGWTRINTDANKPTEEQISHNINNGWYVYYSSNMYQDFTPDGECEAFIHFSYNGDYGTTAAAQDEWLVSPAITLGENETLRFYHQGEPMCTYYFDWGTFEFDRTQIECNMQAMITTDDGANWQKVWDYERDYVSKLSDADCYDEPSSYHSYAVSLADYAGETVKVAFRYTTIEGYVGNSMMIDGVVVDHPAAGDGWTYLGTGSMADGWVIPALTTNAGEFYDPQDYVFDVEVYESIATPGVYKLSSPYTSQAFPFVSLNANREVTDIIINCTNPEFVVVEPQISGFEHNNPGSKAARYAAPYYISHAGKYFLDEGNEIPDIIAYGYASTFDAATGTITIIKPQYGHMLASGSLDMGYDCSNANDYNTVIKLPEASPEPTWETLGMGTLVDGFLYPGFAYDPKGHGWEVEVLGKSDEPGVYMLKNPYTNANSPFSSINAAPESDADILIKIDASNPDIVVLQPQYSGFTLQNMNYYIGNTAGFYVSQGTPVSSLVYLDEDSKDKLENGVFTFKLPYFGAGADDFGYAWYDEDEDIIQFPAKLYLPDATEIPDDPDTYAEAITLSESSHKGIVGDEFTLTATLMPAAVTDPTIAWKSSDPEVAAVDENGKVTLLKVGEATITAKCKVVKATCAVTVAESAGISDIAADAAEVEYYSVDGVRLQSAPARGIYIKLQGGKATKMIAK